MSYAGKIQKKNEAAPTVLEEEVAKHIFDIESTSMKDLKEFRFSACKEFECPGGKKNNNNAIVIFVPFVVHKASKSMLPKLIRELEKKMSKKYFLIVANRTILDKNFRRKGIQERPRSRTLTAVHEAILEDVVSPSEITGKRVRVNHTGGKVLKISLDAKEKETVGEKLHVFAEVYRQLTNKETVFCFQF